MKISSSTSREVTLESIKEMAKILDEQGVPEEGRTVSIPTLEEVTCNRCGEEVKVCFHGLWSCDTCDAWVLDVTKTDVSVLESHISDAMVYGMRVVKPELMGRLTTEDRTATGAAIRAQHQHQLNVTLRKLMDNMNVAVLPRIFDSILRKHG